MFVLLNSVPNITCLLHSVYYLPLSNRERTASKVRCAVTLILSMIAHCLYFSSNTLQVVRSRGLRLAVHVARMGERRGAYKVLVGKPEGNST
jgi:ABC-type protease/lipase transport system fused ATPase/permease subunit